MKKLHILTFLISLVFIPHFVLAQATLYFSPSDLRETSETYVTGQLIETKVLIDTNGDTIGVGESIIRFSGEHLEVVAISKEDSIFTLWVEEPQVVGNIMRFVGGVPGGFSGRGEIFSVTFRAKTDATAGVLFDSARVLSFTAQPKNVLEHTGEAWYPFKVPTAIPKDFLFTEELQEDSRNIDVAYLQLVLEFEGLYDKDITGRFDEDTERAVKRFQERYANDILTPQDISIGTGVVEVFTRRKLNTFVPEITAVEKPTLFDVLIAPEGEDVPSRVIILLIVSAGIGITLAFVLVISVPKLRRWLASKKRRRDNESRQ